MISGLYESIFNSMTLQYRDFFSTYTVAVTRVHDEREIIQVYTTYYKNRGVLPVYKAQITIYVYGGKYEINIVYFGLSFF